MNECKECKKNNAVTDCDKCSKRTCRECCQLIVIKNELQIMHISCVPIKYAKIPVD